LKSFFKKKKDAPAKLEKKSKTQGKQKSKDKKDEKK
jgi:hypothetical protein